MMLRKLDELPLVQTLTQFRSQVNNHPRVQSLIRDWEPLLIIDAIDTGHKLFVPVHNCEMGAITSDLPEVGHTVHLRADEKTLISIFNGRSNPAEAFLNGFLEIFASDKDQVKLDAISLVLWGM
jgi:hypothetical protein